MFCKFVASLLQVCCRRVALQQKANVEKEIEIELDTPYIPLTGGEK